jgi:adenylate cyclase
MIFLLLMASMESGSARGTAGFAVGIFSLLILLSSFGLVRRLIIATACSCTLFEVWLQAHSGVTVGAMVAAAVVMALVAASCIFLVDRFKKLTLTIATEQLRSERMGRYFSPQVASLMNQEEASELSGKSQDITVLFCDIRGFTAMTEALGNKEVVDLLNDYFTAMVDVVFEHGGTLDKFMGDGILAYFGAPIIRADHADRALRCAQSMQTALAEYNAERALQGHTAIETVAVVHSGPAILGNIGSDRRREFTAIGKTVNVAARMEAVAKEREATILVSHACKERVKGDFPFVELTPAKLRSVPEPLRCYSLGGPTNAQDSPAQSH